MTTEEHIADLPAQLKQVAEQLSQTQEELCVTQEELRATQEKLRVAYARIEELEKPKTPPPAFVKANVKKPKEGQKKRSRSVIPSTTRLDQDPPPTQVVEHRLICCPDCHLRFRRD